MPTFRSTLFEVLVCIDCNQHVDFFPLSKDSGYFLCSTCHNIHLYNEGIAVFLPKTHENKLFFNNFFVSNFDQIKKPHHRFFKLKTNKISQNKNTLWEDEDVKFWDQKYKLALEANKPDEKKYNKNPRDTARKKHLFDFLIKKSVKKKIVCEVGTGEADTVRNIFNPKEYGYYYIPTDYSFYALKYLKNIFGKKEYICYIQCLGDQLPFRNNFLDYLIVLGVLHHMPKKEQHIKKLSNYVKKNGIILIEEPYSRESKMSEFFFNHTKFIFEPNHSEHEERPEKSKLVSAIKHAGELKQIHHLYSPIMTVCMFLFSKFSFFQNVKYIRYSLFLDQIWIATIGRIIPGFGSGQCHAVIKKVN